MRQFTTQSSLRARSKRMSYQSQFGPSPPGTKLIVGKALQQIQFSSRRPPPACSPIRLAVPTLRSIPAIQLLPPRSFQRALASSTLRLELRGDCIAGARSQNIERNRLMGTSSFMQRHHGNHCDDSFLMALGRRVGREARV